MDKKSIEDIILEIKKSFNVIGSYSYNSILGSFVSNLLKHVEKVRVESELPSLKDLYQNGNLKLKEHTLAEVKDWFIQQFKQLENLMDPDFYDYCHKVQQAILYIKKNYKLQITRKDIADYLGISSVYISQLFKKETQRTYLDYLTQYRINMAKDLLLNTEKKVYEIAESVGYTSSQYFSQVFYKETGQTPLDYREEGVIK